MWQAQQSGVAGLQAVHLVGWADDDYICARKLLLDGFLIQGAVLSNTAIEKYLKAVVRVKDLKFKRTHDVVHLYEQLKGSGFAPLHEGYLRTLRKAYKMRYPDDLEANFNVGLCQSQMLAELDASVFAIRSGFGFRMNNGTPMKTAFDVMLEKADPRLVDRNSAFSNYKRLELFKGPVPCYDIRVMPDGTIMQVSYTAFSQDNGDFEGEALAPAPPHVEQQSAGAGAL